MLIPKATLLELLEYHYDRRRRVLDFLAAKVTPEDFLRPMKAGWSSMQGILVHAIQCEEFWVHSAMRQGAQPDWDSSQYRDAASVRQLAADVQARTEEFVAGLTDADLAREATMTYFSGYTFSFTLAKGFLHMITHETHHRGQVLLLARQLGYEPPEIDLM